MKEQKQVLVRKSHIYIVEYHNSLAALKIQAKMGNTLQRFVSAGINSFGYTAMNNILK